MSCPMTSAHNKKIYIHIYSLSIYKESRVCRPPLFRSDDSSTFLNSPLSKVTIVQRFWVRHKAGPPGSPQKLNVFSWFCFFQKPNLGSSAGPPAAPKMASPKAYYLQGLLHFAFILPSKNQCFAPKPQFLLWFCSFLIEKLIFSGQPSIDFSQVSWFSPFKNHGFFNVLRTRPFKNQRFFKVSAPGTFRIFEKPMDFQRFELWSLQNLTKTHGFSRSQHLELLESLKNQRIFNVLSSEALRIL